MVESTEAEAMYQRRMKANEAIPPLLKVFPIACPAHSMMMVQK